jgi:hypothetical protein
MLQPTVSRSVCLGVQPPSWGPKTRFLLLSKTVAGLLMWGAVILWSESRGTHDHILLSQVRDSPNLEGQAPLFISPGNRAAQLYPQALGPLFVTSYVSSCLPVRVRVTVRLTVYRQSVRLGDKPLEDHDQSFFLLQPNPCGHRPYVTYSLTRGWICPLWRCLASVKCTYRTCSTLLNILSCTSPLSVQGLQSRSCLS